MKKEFRHYYDTDIKTSSLHMQLLLYIYYIDCIELVYCFIFLLLLRNDWCDLSTVKCE